MKKILLLSLGVIFSLLLAGCSNDEETQSELVGTWEIQTFAGAWSEPIQLDPSEAIITFSPNHMLKVKSISAKPLDSYFLPTGTYPYQITSKSTITIGGIIFNYYIIDGILRLNHIEESCPAYYYTFSRYMK